MTRHLLVHQDGKEHVLPETQLPTEEKLHTAFEKYPQLLPTEELNLGQLMVVGREVGFESGAADLIYVDEGGQIVIVELKKGTENPDSRRVVAQMLDYGSHLWGYTFEDFESKIALPYLRKRHGAIAPSSLRQAAANQFKFEDPAQGVDAFAQALTDNLEKGTFTYAVVGRTLPPTLNTVLRYLGEVSRVQTAAIAVDFHQDGVRHILAPRVVFSSTIGPRSKPPTGGPTTRKTTPEQFLREVGEASAFWESFIEFLRTLPGRFYWGSKGFSYRVVVDGNEYSVLRGYPRTAWWLLDRGKGDQLTIITTPTADRPESLKQLLAEVTAPLEDCEGAVPTADGEERHFSFYIKRGLPERTLGVIREVLGSMFDGNARDA